MQPKGVIMLDLKRCVRCNCEVHVLEYNDAEYYEELLLAEGVEAVPGDALCDDCSKELIEVC